MTSLINTLSFCSSACSVLHACRFALHLMFGFVPFMWFSSSFNKLHDLYFHVGNGVWWIQALVNYLLLYLVVSFQKVQEPSYWLFYSFRVCQQEKEEVLIDLGCHCRGGLAKAHRSCIDTWFRSKGSNKCKICQ